MEATVWRALAEAALGMLELPLIVVDAAGAPIVINTAARAELGGGVDAAVAAAAACARGEPVTDTSLVTRALLDEGGVRIGALATALAPGAALRRANLFLDSIVENIPAVIFVKEADQLRYQLVNRTTEQLVGRSRDQMLGRTDFEVFPTEQARFFQRKDREALAAGTVVDITEEPIDTPDGVRWLHTRKIPVLDERGRPRYLLGISTDITERKRAEDEIRTIHDELERRVDERTAALHRAEEHLRQAQKLEAIGRLAGGVAHDFNNLLTVIMAQASMAARDTGALAKVRPALDGILDAARRAANLTRQLLVFSRQQVVQPRRLDLVHLVAELMPTLGRLVGEHITLRVVPPHAGAVWVEADPGQIEQVILNLVVNARDAMPDGGELDVAVDQHRLTEAVPGGPPPGNHALLTVRDTGLGMDDATVTRIFEPFFTTKEQGQGTGLGLATVYGIITASGGVIRVHTTPGQGSRFDVYLPLVSAGSDDERAPAGSPSPGGHETVLLVEDDAMVRESLAHTLQAAGYVVVEAGDGRAALRVLDSVSGAVHVLITDVVMPMLGGRELARRARISRPELRVLFISGYVPGLVEDGIGAREAFLAKPFEPAALLRRVRELLDASAQGPL